MKPNEGFIDFDPKEVSSILNPGTQKRNIFLEQAKAANPDIGVLKRDYELVVKRIGAIKKLMASPNGYPGSISDLGNLDDQKRILEERIKYHVDNRKGFDAPGTSGRKN